MGQIGYVVPPRSTNGLGIAGFIISLVGFIGCPLIAPLGLILSFVAVFRQPKGFAIAGLVLGILGSTWFLVLLLAVLGVTVIGGGLLMLVMSTLGLKGLEAHIEMAVLDSKIAEYRSAHSSVPPTLGALPNLDPQLLSDPWGHAYVYTPGADGTSFNLTSDGPDGQTGTADDLKHSGSR